MDRHGKRDIRVAMAQKKSETLAVAKDREIRNLPVYGAAATARPYGLREDGCRAAGGCRFTYDF